MKPEEIKAQAKKIMDNFMSSMKDIEVEEDFVFKREKCFRVEGEGKIADEGFRNRFFKNAPKVQNDSIVANKGAWTNK